MRTLIADGNYLLHRVYHTHGWSLSDGDGDLTGGCYGVIKTLHMALERLSSIGEVVVVWDGKRSKRRKELYPEYKANRDGDAGEKKEFYDEFDRQQRLLEAALPSLGVKSVRLEDREGDDTIFWLSRFAGDAVIVSDDKDMLLMLAPTVDVYRPMKEEFYTCSYFEEVFGFPPEFYLVYKAIIGDDSDNIKGVHGAGPKAALEFVKNYASNSNALEETKSHRLQRLRSIPEQWDIVERNMKLMDVREEKLTVEEISKLAQILATKKEADIDKFYEFAKQHKFVSMMSEAWFRPFAKLTR